jgi:hypothetical protein
VEEGLMKQIVGLMLLIVALQAEMQTFQASFSYIMGDNDSKNDARQICFLEAKKRLIEKIGVFVESESIVENYRLTHFQIRSYSAALLSIEIIDENFYFNNGLFRIDMKVSTRVDRDELLRNLERITENKDFKQKLEQQQHVIEKLDNRIQHIQTQLTSAKKQDVISLRKERNIVFKKISAHEKIKFEIQAISKRAVDLITSGMTINQVMYLIGQYRNRAECEDEHWFYNYGEIWIWCPNKIVKGYIKVSDWTGPCDWKIYNRTYHKFVN